MIECRREDSMKLGLNPPQQEPPILVMSVCVADERIQHEIPSELPLGGSRSLRSREHGLQSVENVLQSVVRLSEPLSWVVGPAPGEQFVSV